MKKNKTRITLSIPASAVEKILKDPEAFKKYMKKLGFEVLDVGFCHSMMKDQKKTSKRKIKQKISKKQAKLDELASLGIIPSHLSPWFGAIL